MSKYSIFIIFLLIVACNNNEKNAISNKINKQTQTKTTKTKKIFVADKSKNNCLSCHTGIAPIMDGKFESSRTACIPDKET